MNTQQKGMQPAFPAFPLQDNFGKFATPFPGFSKLEFIALVFFKEGFTLKESFSKAIEFLQAYDEFINSFDEDTKETILKL